MKRKSFALLLAFVMLCVASVPALAAPTGGEKWIDSTGNTSEPRDSRDVRNNTNGFDTSGYTPIKYEGEVTLYAQNYGYENDDNYDIKLYTNSGGKYTKVGRLYGYGDSLKVEVFEGHAVTLVWQRHQLENKYYVVELTGPFATTYKKDMDGENTGYTSGNIYVKYTAASMPEKPSADAPSSWAAEQVNAAAAVGIVPESLQSKYTQATTRAEFCALAVDLYETATGAEITGRTQFTDTTDINVEKMASLKVVNGIDDGKFAPDQKLTREQAATMLTRLASAMGKSLTAHTPTFADSASVSIWATDSVGQVQAAGIMSGVGGNKFDPKGDYTREQSIMTMMRLFKAVR
ncbi:S-layer homology domain-containing protein [Oscillospiraceae bacterium OttesenSCG-928-G22]|nr:S-layer homology domain-containing protein [Oscillospiraceae bacterium OttesenSCG-928-G22]